MSRVRSASGLLKRNMRAATGVRASTRPDSSAAAGENQRRTAAYSTATAATPSSAWGPRMLQLLTPKMRAAASMGHRNAGDLSTVMELAESSDPKRKAFQLLVAAWTAAE